METENNQKKIKPIQKLEKIAAQQIVKELETTEQINEYITMLSEIPTEYTQIIMNEASFPIYLKFLESNKFPEIFQNSSELYNKKLSEEENKYRELFAQKRDDPKLNDSFLLTFDPYKNSQYVERKPWDEYEKKLPKILLPEKLQRSHELTIAPTFKEFQNNLDIFSFGQLNSIDWNNVIVAGGSVLAALMPVPQKDSQTKSDQRKYYLSNTITAKSDIDLFIYGLTETQATEKVEQIITAIQNENPHQIHVVRSVRCLTIFSEYPFRHVQIIFRLYKNPAEVLLGFDVDSCAVGYNGKQVLMSYRCARALSKQYNLVDLTRRSPSYEYRLYKYHFRGFAVAVPGLDNSKVNKKIFTDFPSHKEAKGLAKLLILDKKGIELKNTPLQKQPSNSRNRRQAKPKDESKEDKNLALIKSAEKGDYYKSLKKIVRIPDSQKLDKKLFKYETGLSFADYSSLYIPFSPDIRPKKIIQFLDQKRKVLNDFYYAYSSENYGLPRVPFCFGNNLQETFQDVKNFASSLNEMEDDGDPNAEKMKKVFDRYYLNPENDFGITWMTVDPGRQMIGSWHPSYDDWFAQAYL